MSASSLFLNEYLESWERNDLIRSKYPNLVRVEFADELPLLLTLEELGGQGRVVCSEEIDKGSRPKARTSGPGTLEEMRKTRQIRDLALTPRYKQADIISQNEHLSTCLQSHANTVRMASFRPFVGL